MDFDREIRPILSDNCFACHGPDAKQRQANLRLDIKEGALADRGTYRIIVPGDSASSRLYQRISADKKAARMPPPYATTSLTQDQIGLIKRWIDQGARWEAHWAYVPPQRPPMPSARNKSWPRNPIDHFVLARLEQEGLQPSSEADKPTLLRRLSYDLTGLPPSPKEIDAFLADRSPQAYEKQVDRLLQSPHYGERMAMQWLDLARYADTHGYHIDSHRDMWIWRDWVISAFNRNIPFDRFTIMQLAGDLLPNPTTEDLIATGFNRNHMINFEGGAIPEEYQNEYVVDRVEATSITWMATTMGCARCHDHKYDPIKQKEFYEFYAFFNNVDEKGLDGQTGNARPYLRLPSPEQHRRHVELENAICSREVAMPEEKVRALQAEWEKTRAATLPQDPREGIVAHYEFDGNLADTSGRYHRGRTVRGEVVFTGGYIGKAAEFSGETQVALGNVEEATNGGPLSLALWLRYSGSTGSEILQKVDAAAGRRGFELTVDESVPIGDLKRGAWLILRLTSHWPDNAIEIRSAERLVQGDWRHVAVVYDGSGKAAGWKLFLDGKPAEFVVLRDTLSGPTRSGAPLEIGNKTIGRPYRGRIDDLRLYNRVLTPREIEDLAVHYPVRAALEATGKRTEEDDARLREYFLTWDAPEEFRGIHAELTALTKQKEELEKTIPTAMIMEELPSPRETHVLGRGDYRSLGERVFAGVPGVLPTLPEGAPRNRLGLAKWLVEPSHPLTARVAVNRYWQMCFGAGLVKTAENFGSQGEPPSNPELLDWLATEFIRTGWDMKALHRLIVTSATYRQSSAVTPELLDKDPENRLLARGPRFRLPGEMIRDGALSLSGLLDRRTGGHGVYPYQPKGVWEDIAYGDVFSAQSYTPSNGPDLYRRSLYTFWKRTAPPPSMITFDAPDREKCAARRPLTNTPLQALVLMNDPTYVEAARALAQRTIKEGGSEAAGRIRYAFRLATARWPGAQEAQVLSDLWRRKLSDYRRDGDAALKLLGAGEVQRDKTIEPAQLAAWTAVASVILNLDETITKE